MSADRNSFEISPINGENAAASSFLHLSFHQGTGREAVLERGRFMSIAWNCACGKHLKAPDGSEGKRARCPACGQINQVPTPQLEPVVAEGDSPFDEYALAETPAPR
jgi:hypothetical protein